MTAAVHLFGSTTTSNKQRFIIVKLRLYTMVDTALVVILKYCTCLQFLPSGAFSSFWRIALSEDLGEAFSTPITSTEEQERKRKKKSPAPNPTQLRLTQNLGISNPFRTPCPSLQVVVTSPTNLASSLPKETTTCTKQSQYCAPYLCILPHTQHSRGGKVVLDAWPPHMLAWPPGSNKHLNNLQYQDFTITSFGWGDCLVYVAPPLLSKKSNMHRRLRQLHDFGSFFSFSFSFDLCCNTTE
ncbi:hypothetical protein QBC44DRAFT_102577 [Cladorrhinum sp. PSN332]|nr:hypothetical protein QBC44DRAFT_102577 [Cladorrhinum sp. PSN332]